MDTSAFSKKDAKLIESNPSATVEQLRELGMTEKGSIRYAQILAGATGNPEDSDNDIIGDTPGADKPTESPIENMQRKPRTPRPQVSPVNDSIQPRRMPAPRPIPKRGGVFETVEVIGPTGRPQKMSAVHAKRLIEKNPKKFRYG